MGRFCLIMLAGFVVGAPAAPASLAFGLPHAVALIAVLLGVQGCFAVSLFAMDRLRAWYAARTQRPPSRAAARASALLARIGPVGFGLVAPTLFGTWGAALLGTGLGLGRWRLLAWLTAGTALWSAALLFGASAALDTASCQFPQCEFPVPCEDPRNRF